MSEDLFNTILLAAAFGWIMTFSELRRAMLDIFRAGRS